MKREIKKITLSSRSPDCYVLEFDTGEKLFLPVSISPQYHLRSGSKIDEDLYSKLLRYSQEYKAKEAALRYVGYKARTAYQVQKYLERKGFPPEAVAAALAFLKQYRYIDDARYVRHFVEQYLKQKPSGIYRVRYELRQKGIAAELIDRIIEEVEQSYDQLELARLATQQKMRALRSKPREKQQRAIAAFLQRRGFSWDVIRTILEEFFSVQ